MAIRPTEFTSQEMQLICRIVLDGCAPTGSEIRGRVEQLLAQANHMNKGFYVASLAGPSLTDTLMDGNPDEAD